MGLVSDLATLESIEKSNSNVVYIHYEIIPFSDPLSWPAFTSEMWWFARTLLDSRPL